MGFRALAPSVVKCPRITLPRNRGFGKTGHVPARFLLSSSSTAQPNPSWDTIVEALRLALAAKDAEIKAKDQALRLALDAKDAKDAEIKAKDQALQFALEAKDAGMQAQKEKLEVLQWHLMRSQGLFNTRGIIEYTENQVVRPATLRFAPKTRQQMWLFFLSQPDRRGLLACLEAASKMKGALPVSRFITSLYHDLSTAIHGSDDMHAPDAYSDVRKVFISGDLHNNNAALVCLCEEFNYPYQLDFNAATRPADP